MSNEILLVLFLIAYMLFAVGCYRMGRVWLQNFLALSYILVLIITSKFGEAFGMTMSTGVVVYSGIFLATDMLTERYGKAAAFQTIRISFAMAAIFTLVTQASLLLTPVEHAVGLSESMAVVFGTSLRMVLASTFAYLVAQHFDVWFYHHIHEKTKGRMLWLRNCMSTMTSQVLDSVLFFTLAFYGTMPNNVFFEILLVGICAKLVIALLDTPFIYLARRIKPLDIKA